MIEVNLQPGSKKRGSRGPKFSLKLPTGFGLPRDPWVLISAVVVLVTASVGTYLYLTTSGREGELGIQIEEARADSARYADLIQQNDALLARRDSIAQRVSIIQEIDGDRYVWAHIMDEVARSLPEYTWLTAILQVSVGDGLLFRVDGQTGNTFALTQFMRNLEMSSFIRNVNLITTEQVVAESAEGGVRRAVYQFQLEALYDPPPVEFLETVPLFDESSTGQ